MLEKNATIYIVGHQGVIGSVIHSELIKAGYSNFVLHASLMKDLGWQPSIYLRSGLIEVCRAHEHSQMHFSKHLTVS